MQAADMLTKVKIALQAPYTEKTNRYFSLRLKRHLNIEPAKYPKPGRMLVVSDIEGDFKTFCHVLSRGGVINERLQWTFGDGHLVILGNCFNNDRRTIEYLWFIYALEEKARRKGGYVHFILGNNEIKNLNGDWRYAHPNYAKADPSSGNPSTALYDANSELWRWLRTKNIMEKVGGILFVHGGVGMEVIQTGLSLSELNNLARPYYAAAGGTFQNPVLHMLLSSEQAPFQYRGYYQQGISEREIDMVLRYFKVQTIVIGHTMVEQVSGFYNGKVINVSTDHANGKSEALLTRKRHFYRIDQQGKWERIK
jgi:hypothetical protein